MPTQARAFRQKKTTSVDKCVTIGVAIQSNSDLFHSSPEFIFRAHLKINEKFMRRI